MKPKSLIIIAALVMGCSLLLKAQDTSQKQEPAKVPACRMHHPHHGMNAPEPPPPPPPPEAPGAPEGEMAPPPPPPPPPAPLIPDLTEEQAAAMKKLQLDLSHSLLQAENELGEKQARLKTLTTADAPDKKAVDKVIEEIGVLHTRIMKLKVATDLEMRKVLNSEQRLIFDRRKRMN